MAAHVLLTSIAAAVAIETCHRFERTAFQRLTEHISGWDRPPASVATVVSEHDLMPARLNVKVYDIESEA